MKWNGRFFMSGPALRHENDVPVAYALGHKHIEQYIGVPGRLQALPIAFDILKREWFGLFEGENRRPEDWGHWTNRA